MKDIKKIALVTSFVLLFSIFGCKKKPLLERVKVSNQIAQEYIINNFRRKGVFVYGYNIKRKRRSRKNNMIRQLMTSRLLAEMCQEDPSLRIKHKRNVRFIMKYWYKEDKNTGYIFYNKKSKLGAIAMFLRTLVYSPFFEKYKETAKKLYNSIIKLQNKDGDFDPFFIDPPYRYNRERMLYFYSGEAILAMVEYAEKINDRSVLKAAIKSQEYYIDKYVKAYIEGGVPGYYPAYVPWHAQSLNRLYKITKKQEYAEAVFIMTDKLLEILDTSKYVGRFYSPKFPQYGKPHAASDGVYTEGLAYAYELAVMLHDTKRQKKYLKALDKAIGNLISLQVKDGGRREKGGFRTRVDSNYLRIDNTQHTVDAYMKILKVVKAPLK